MNRVCAPRAQRGAPMLNPLPAAIHKAAIGILLALVLLLAGLLWRQHLATAGAQTTLAQAEARHSQQLARLEAAARDASTAALRATEARVAAVAAIDSHRTQELSDALAENDRMRAADAAGPGRLRIPATCPARPAGADGVPSTTASASVDAPAAEVAADVRSALRDLRAALITERAQLQTLQDYVRDVCAGGRDGVAR